MTVSSATTAAISAAKSTTGGALNSLSGNFNDFLNLLMTQLKNQDPTTPMDTNQFTSQLVQYSSVEQQIHTNTNLQSLIQATQSNTVLQSASLIGKQVDVTNDHLALQNGSASVHFDAPKAEPVNVTVTSSNGTKVLNTTVSAQAGTNNWSWDGRNSQGSQLPDGSYQVAVVDASGTPISTTITGTVTALQRNTSGINVSLGALNTDVSTIQSVSSTN